MRYLDIGSSTPKSIGWSPPDKLTANKKLKTIDARFGVANHFADHADGGFEPSTIKNRLNAGGS
jgi:hypothetical protein